jgi:ketosteroid isomerase-like protein
MADESTTPDLAQRVGRWVGAVNRRDVDALMSFFASDAVRETLGADDERLRGRTAIRAMLEDWFRPCEEYEAETEEVHYLGNGVLFSVVVNKGRPINSSSFVQWRQGFVVLMDGDLIGRAISYRDIDDARAAAERLAEERG